ncbi:MAG: thiamine pyrophosphate-binding protein [Streptosporangiales bacterium]|nr:thiamine pyrophosphate-binding protein [Streptosporangiales bacterium]
MEMTGGEALARQLALEGVSQVFGVPGVQLDYALDGLAKLPDDPVRFVTTRHEQAASYMADGSARSTGEVGVCVVVPGPGLLNASAGLATAYACSSPVVCVCGQIPSGAIGRGLGVLHEIPDQSGVLGSLTKWSGIASEVGQVPGLVREAFRQARAGRPRPVGVEVPPDVLEATGRVDLVQPDGSAGDVAAGAVLPDPELLDKAASLLRSARRPVIYAGGGAVGGNAGEPLRELAEALEAPVVMSPNGRGALSDRHRLALTSVGGSRVLPDADVVLVVGSRFITPRGTPVPTSADASVVLLGADPADLGDPREPALAVHGDARLGLAGLLERVDGLPTRPSRRSELEEVRRWCDEEIARLEPQASWVRALRSAIPEDGVLVAELTQVAYLTRAAYPVYGPRTYLGPGYQGTLGYGFPTALGAKAANPDRAVVSITGDGGFGYALPELATARQYGIGVVTVVFDDSAYGNVRRDQRDKFGARFIGSELRNPDFVALAGAFGIGAERATTPERLAAVLREALAAGEPFLVEVPVGEMPNPWGLLGRFGTP